MEGPAVLEQLDMRPGPDAIGDLVEKRAYVGAQKGLKCLFLQRGGHLPRTKDKHNENDRKKKTVFNIDFQISPKMPGKAIDQTQKLKTILTKSFTPEFGGLLVSL